MRDSDNIIRQHVEETNEREEREEERLAAEAKALRIKKREAAANHLKAN